MCQIPSKADHLNTSSAAQLADLAAAEARRHPPRPPERRAACHLWAACLPGRTTLTAIRRAVATFGSERTQAAALALLGKITATEGTPE